MKKYGIRGSLPPGDPLRAPHLLGDDWQWERWYETRAERDKAYGELQHQFRYYRKGDRPSQVLERLDPDG